MPCRPDEEDMQLHAAVSRGTFPSTPPENDGAGHAESDDDGVSTEESMTMPSLTLSSKRNAMSH